ncbi:hypothetical protein WJX84_003290, partial [Apatococcus fuscideae]
ASSLGVLLDLGGSRQLRSPRTSAIADIGPQPQCRSCSRVPTAWKEFVEAYRKPIIVGKADRGEGKDTITVQQAHADATYKFIVEAPRASTALAFLRGKIIRHSGRKAKVPCGEAGNPQQTKQRFFISQGTAWTPHPHVSPAHILHLERPQNQNWQHWCRKWI